MTSRHCCGGRSSASAKCGSAQFDEGPLLLFLAARSGGDARTALQALEFACATHGPEGSRVDIELAEDALQRRAVRFDRRGDQHYDTISAWIKATRGSDPDASLYYLAVMIEGGEDPRFIARRMVILASEDVGNADPSGAAARRRRSARGRARRHAGGRSLRARAGRDLPQRSRPSPRRPSPRAEGRARALGARARRAGAARPLRSSGAYGGARRSSGAASATRTRTNSPATSVWEQELMPEGVARGERYLELPGPDDAEAALRERLDADPPRPRPGLGGRAHADDRCGPSGVAPKAG